MVHKSTMPLNGTNVVTSIQGTADEVLVNGTSGSPVMGDAILSTPQPIATTSEVQFAKVKINTTGEIGTNDVLEVRNGFTLSNQGTDPGTDAVLRFLASGGANYIESGSDPIADSKAPLVFSSMFFSTEWARFSINGGFTIGYPTVVAPSAGLCVAGISLFGVSGTTGTHNVQVSGGILSDTIQLTTGANNGYFLQSDGSGNASWAAVVSGVSSVSGTTNQIDVSPTTGATTASLSSTIILPGTLTTSNTVTLSGLTASTALVLDGSKNIASLAYGTASSASSLVERDANQNAFANSFTNKATNVVSAGGTTTLTAASARWQNLTGSSAQTFQLPDATTLSIGARFDFNNNSSGVLTVKDGGGSTLFTVPSGGQGFALLLVNIVTAGVWDYHFAVPSNTSWGTATLSFPGLVSCTTFQMTTGASSGYILQSDGSGNASWLSTLGVSHGGTGQTSYIDGQLLIGNTATGGLTKATLTAGTNITITNGNGSITIDATGGGGGVTSITGTANQVIASSPTGAITLSTPQDIATSSSVQFGNLAIGGSLSANSINSIIVSGTKSYALKLSGTITGQTAGQTLIFNDNTIIQPSSGLTFGSVHYFSPTYDSTNAAITSASTIYVYNTYTGANAVTTGYGIFVDTGSAAPAGGLTNAYGGFFKAPAGGTNKAALYSDNVSVGYTGVTPPSGGAIISGGLGVGINSIAAGRFVNIAPTVTASATLGIGLLVTVSSTYTAAADNDSLEATHISIGTIATAGKVGLTATTLSISNQTPSITGGGTIAAAYGILIGANTTTATDSYGLSVTLPSGSTNNYTAYFSSGPVGIGAISKNYILQIGTYSTAYYGIEMRPTITSTDTGAAGGGMRGIDLVPTFHHTSASAGSSQISLVASGVYATLVGGTIDNVYSIYISNNYTSNAGTITTYRGLYFDGGSAAVGTITNAIGSEIVMPAAGTNVWGMRVTGTGTGSSGGTLIALDVETTLANASGSLAFAAQIYVKPAISTTFTIQSSYGLFIDTGTTSGTVTTGYGLKVNAPASGSTKITAAFVNSTSQPVLIGSSSVNGAAAASFLVVGNSSNLGQIELVQTSSTSGKCYWNTYLDSNNAGVAQFVSGGTNQQMHFTCTSTSSGATFCFLNAAAGTTIGAGGGSGQIYLQNATTVPSSNPTGGGFIYVTAGALKYRGSSGTVTNLGNA